MAKITCSKCGNEKLWFSNPCRNPECPPTIYECTDCGAETDAIYRIQGDDCLDICRDCGSIESMRARTTELRDLESSSSSEIPKLHVASSITKERK